MRKVDIDGSSYRDHSASGVVDSVNPFAFVLENENAAVVQVGGTWTGTLVVDKSMDSGATWQTGVMSIIANGWYEVGGLEGYDSIRVSGVSTGSAEVLIRGAASAGSVTVSGTVTDSHLYTDLATTLHGDLSALPTAKGAGVAGATVARVVAASDSPDVVSLASIDTKLSTLHTDLATTLHADLATTIHGDLAALPTAKGAGVAGATVARVVSASDSPEVTSLASIDGKLLAATATATNAYVAVSTTAVQVLASNSARKAAKLQNTGNSVVWYGFTSSVVPGTSAVANGGFALQPLEVAPPEFFLKYTGALYCICDTGDSTFVTAGSW